ncbi:hypothetical protein [Actibacterium lipolyticum]|uniref:Uncharacterized protein n=1 Tax=Actibacterium lipolyticum TaxID=1524263 RepID=A0A238KRV1_9RHOB|nr:hypothetical protein [Actibacterium lipolyticum]SMX45380.1 hypothetical protein COL8621_02780 [Actibacterium lipolyticum]
MKPAILFAVLTLAACGADGPPVKPTLNTSIGIGSNGVTTSSSVGVRTGNVAVSVGL